MEEYHQQLPTTTTATQPPFITNLIQHNLYLNQPTAAPPNPPTEANQPIPPNQQPTAASNQNYISNPFLLSNSHPDYTLLQSTPITPSPTNQQQPPFLTIHPPAQVLDSNIIPPTLNSQINYQQNHHPQLSISPSTNQLKTTNHPNNSNNNNNHLNSLQVIFPPPSPATSPTENENNKPSTTTSTSPSPNLNQNNKSTIITSHPIPNQQDAINNNNNNKPSKSPKQKNPTHQLSQDFRRRKDWHKRLVEDVMDVLQVVSPTGELLFVSESMTRVTGFSTSELLGAQLASWCYHEEDHNNLDREIKNCFNAGPSGSLNFYCRFKKKNSSSCVIFEMMGHTMRVKTKPGFVSDDQSTKSEKQVMIITARPYPTSCGRLMDEFLELMLENEAMIRLMGGEGGHGGGMETKLGGERSRGNSGTMAAGVMEADEVKNKKKRKSGELVEEISQESPSGKDSEGEEENHHHHPPPSGLPPIQDPHPSDPSQRARPRGPHKRERLDFLCLDCGVTQSPEWRKGPMGRKTLCNACGLRYAKKAK